MSRRKIIFGAISLVIVTALLTSGIFLYLLSDTFGADVIGTMNFIAATRMVREKYVEDVQQDKLMAGAIKGMVNSLGDPHSIYLDPQLYKEFMIETEGVFGGVGIVIEVKDKILTVVSPIEGTPGEQAGIKAGDQILKIDGLDTAAMPLDQAVSKIRGPVGTQVVLNLRRNGQAPQDYIVTRSNIQIKTVSGKMLQDNIGYIRLASFNENTGSDFAKSYHSLLAEGAKGIILDLRDNPGGLLSESVKVASFFVPKDQAIVSVVARDGTKEVYPSKPEGQQTSMPVVVLVNGGSASASEIVSGAVQDTGVGVLVGTKTFGKGSVQTIRNLAGGAAIKLTIAKYLTPSGKSINGIGIEPDYKVELPDRTGVITDTQLDKAIAVIKTKL